MSVFDKLANGFMSIPDQKYMKNIANLKKGGITPTPAFYKFPKLTAV